MSDKEEAVIKQVQNKRQRKQKKEVVEEAPPPQPVQPPPVQEPKPKRKCSQKQLTALAAGRAKNKHFKPKKEPETEPEIDK